MTTAGDHRNGSVYKLLICAMATAICFAIIVPGSRAASPAWRMLAVTGPTDVPPVQSETQKVTVEASAGTFDLSAVVGEAEIAVNSFTAFLSTTEGQRVATINSVEGEGASFEVGARVRGGGFYFSGPEAFVESCSADCKTPNSTVTFSRPADETTSNEEVTIYSKQAIVEAGNLPVGAEVRSEEAETIAPGTTVTAATGSTITLSRPPERFYFEGTLSVTGTQTTAPIGFDASAAEVQSAFDAILGPGGGISVTGGPGGNGENPYLLTFGGPFADRDVPEVIANGANLGGSDSTVNVFTVVPGGAGTGQISISPANIGGLDTTGEYEIDLGPLPNGIVVRGAPFAKEGSGEISCEGERGAQSVVCTSSASVPKLSVAESIIVPIEVTDPAEFEGSVPIVISGGNSRTDSITMPIKVSSLPAPQGINALLAGAFDADGNPEMTAGGHPYSALSYFLLNTVRLPNGYIAPHGDLRTALVDLPPGFSGNPLATPRCPQAQLTPPNAEDSGDTAVCNRFSKVGVFQPSAQGFGGPSTSIHVNIYNDVPPLGSAAEFTSLISILNQSLLGSVRSSEDFGIRISALNVPTYYRVYGAFAALEGFPVGAGGKPFLSNATSCVENARENPVLRVQTETWQEPNAPSPLTSAALPPVVGCGALQFEPSFNLRPSTTTGSSGAGAIAELHIPQEGLADPAKLATPALKKAVVRLPAGLSLNASAASGLQSCSEQQIGFMGANFPLPNPIRFNEASPSCPDGSKLGTVEVDSPLVESPLMGTIFLANQEENPFGSLLAIYLVIDDARTGIVAKLPGELQADPRSGQLTATFDYNPQLAFEDLKLVFRGGGPRSELATPEVCGHYETTGSLEPWSAPESGPPALIKEGGFDVSEGCASSIGARPFAPTLEAGTTGTQAGAYSPLVIKINRKDGEQELKSLDFTLPKGLLGRVAGIPYCSESAIHDAESKSGKAEQSSASCPAASQIGVVDTAAGVGTEPFHVGGKVYLAGPYKGAPLSSVVVTPAVAGPFDLGDVVIRAPLYVDPETAQITARSDQIPTILRGIPLKVRSVAIYLNRSDFTLNPTSCEPMAVTASIQASEGAVAKPSERFQVGGCKGLRFKPKLGISLKGSTTRTGHPALKAVLTYPTKGAYANIARAQVNLPHSEFLAQGNLNKTCTKPVLLEGKCPKSSIYGRAEAWTPLLENPVQGPVYLVGGYGYKLPALVADLNGQIRVVLKGKVDTGKNKGIRNTFEAVPDAPVSRFVLRLKGGKKYGLLENSEDLCVKPQRAVSRFTAQNGLVSTIKTSIARQCGRKAKKHGPKKP